MHSFDNLIYSFKFYINNNEKSWNWEFCGMPLHPNQIAASPNGNVFILFYGRQWAASPTNEWKLKCFLPFVNNKYWLLTSCENARAAKESEIGKSRKLCSQFVYQYEWHPTVPIFHLSIDVMTTRARCRKMIGLDRWMFIALRAMQTG